MSALHHTRFLITTFVIIFAICQLSLATDAEHLSLIEDGAGLFNERGFLKSNSFSLDGNEIINNYNGNLIYSQGLQYYPITQTGLHQEMRISYNGSVGHVVNSSLGSEGGQFSKQQNVNLPEWIISINNIAIQTFNFENEVISWETGTDPNNNSIDKDVAALITGYHSCYIHTPGGGPDPTYGTISILMGDGSVLQLKSTSSAHMTSKLVYSGEYSTFSKEDRTRGYVDPVTSEFTLFFENGIRVKFKFYNPLWKNDITVVEEFPLVNTIEEPKMYLPISFMDRFGNSTGTVKYDSTMDCGGGPTKIYGRPLVSTVANYNWDWGGLLNGWQENTLKLSKNGFLINYTINFSDYANSVAPSICDDGSNRASVNSIIDAVGRTTSFAYRHCLRFGDNFGPVTFNFSAGYSLTSGEGFLLYPSRLFNITSPDGGITYYSYYNDTLTKWPNPGVGVDSLGINLEFYCPNGEQKPCIKTAEFDNLGRDPFFTNMVVEKTREDSGVYISRDSLLFDWNDYDTPQYAISINDEFVTTRFAYGLNSSGTEYLAQKLEFDYRQYPEKGDFSTATRDRGWVMKLINQKTYESDEAPSCSHSCPC